jgi:DNA-binding response OmpR family regulator
MDKPHIMVVEDDTSILRQIEYALTTNGFEVTTATTGVEALKKMMLRRPHLLLTDVMMPEMDGHELVRSVRDDPSLADIPIIMLTALAQDESMIEGYSSGTDLYLTKPFEPAELVSFVRRIAG